ncbi:MAG TPA: protein kinase, partial [Streptosporangiaceae bacterium]
MAADHAWAVPGCTAVRELGDGASGRVVLATDDRTGAPVAIKYLAPRLLDDPGFADGFREDARALTAIRDPNTVRVYDYVADPRGAAIVMEAVDGVSLRRVLDTGQVLGPEVALAVLKATLLGLGAAHAAGVLH